MGKILYPFKDIVSHISGDTGRYSSAAVAEQNGPAHADHGNQRNYAAHPVNIGAVTFSYAVVYHLRHDGRNTQFHKDEPACGDHVNGKKQFIVFQIVEYQSQNFTAFKKRKITYRFYDKL